MTPNPLLSLSLTHTHTHTHTHLASAFMRSSPVSMLLPLLLDASLASPAETAIPVVTVCDWEPGWRHADEG